MIKEQNEEIHQKIADLDTKSQMLENLYQMIDKKEQEVLNYERVVREIK
jgi:hypothetical protein